MYRVYNMDKCFADRVELVVETYNTQIFQIEQLQITIIFVFSVQVLGAVEAEQQVVNILEGDTQYVVQGCECQKYCDKTCVNS